MCTFKNLVLINDLSVCCNNQPDQKQTQITLTENIKELCFNTYAETDLGLI